MEGGWEGVVGETERERERERPGRLWGRRRPHLQCCVQKECLTAFQRGKGRGGEVR